ncbi:MAG: flagellar protein [Candidatus Abyssobacteria bacterium SURF_5]|uniref:Flagellar protein n=1 Tax=Abyssobacteria bacterium (strain SURF_5) TaxID=2093360 RepID=A0A3A4MY45_ABYX5|nr:MAG: flagellar protein [Candidatus Abyssubacteria bacterium SURF_5]
MMNRVNLNESQPVQQIRQAHPAPGSGATRETFDAVMRKELAKLRDVKFSAHALSRIASRNIQMEANERTQIAEAVNRAEAKGARDSLVLLDKAALIVSVENRTVVTVLDREEMRGNVFTNIDSAVLMYGST